jgi:EAL domain-containing protein (putative c-di-GMP-specific phosphodiesterase class I)
MHDAALRRLGERAELERALANHEMVLHYQPIVDLATGTVAGLEALIRWNHPTRGLIGPDAFIGTAEETGLIVPVGRWALDTACDQVARWVREGIVPVDLGLSVNLSPRQLQDEHLVADVAAAIRRSGIAPACLTLEMTETLLVDDMSAAVITLDALKALDVRLAIDDFGTGYSSINYLSRLPIDILKVDRSFVAAASDPGDPRARLARTMLGLGHSVGMPAVAEGIENAAQASLVRELGCQFGQGFYFGRPVDAAATTRLFRVAPERLPRPAIPAAPRELLPGPHAARIPA